MSESTDDFLAHYGVKGMKWGRRKARSSSESSSSSETSGSQFSGEQKKRISPSTKKKIAIGVGVVGAAALIAAGAYAANKHMDANAVKTLGEMRKQVETRRAGEAAARKQLDSFNSQSKFKPGTYSKANRQGKKQAVADVKNYDAQNAARRQAFAERTAANRAARDSRQRRLNTLTSSGRQRNRDADLENTRRFVNEMAKRSKWEIAAQPRKKQSSMYRDRDVKSDTKLYGPKGQARIQKRVDGGETLSSARQKEAARQNGMQAARIALNINSAQRREGREYDRLRKAAQR